MFSGQGGLLPPHGGLDDKRIDRLQDFLDTIPNSMHFEHIDGFFCALVLGPVEVPPGEFLPYIFGGHTHVFKSQEEADEIMGILIEHWEHLANTFDNRKPYYPFLFSDRDDKISANDWADAFMLGVQLRQDHWSELIVDNDEHALLKEIILLRNEISESPDGRSLTIPSAEREFMIDSMVANMNRIYEHFSDLRDEDETE